MQLPAPLRAATADLAREVPVVELRTAAESISCAYRTSSAGGPQLRTRAEHLAYLLVRMPATFVAVTHALARLGERIPEFSPTSLLDLGAGPGTAAWAAVELFPS